jgi:hypothetical protein
MRKLPTTLGSLALAAISLPAAALTPTSDGRSIFVAQATPTETATPVPFQPFSASRLVLSAGLPVSGASQESSILADGIVAEGSAFSEFPGLAISESVFDVQFDLTEGSVFTLQGTLRRQASSGISLVLERLAPNPAVLISFAQTVTLDELAGMPPGSYRLRAVATGTSGFLGSYPLFDFDFQLECSSPNPLDSDGDGFVDPCDLCPLDFDPGQEDTDGDGFGDACNDAVDGDGDDWADTLDNCPLDANADQMDQDFDALGDVCDVPEVIEEVLDPDVITIFELHNPIRAAMAPSGVAYVAASSSRNVFRIPRAPGVASELFDAAALGANVSDVAVGPDGFVYTAGGTTASSYRIDPSSGAATLVIDAQGDGQGALLQNAGRVVVAADGRVFVSGRDSQNVFEVTPGGAITQVIGPSGNGTTALGPPSAIDVDGAGNLYVLSNGTNPRLFRVTPSHQVELLASSGFGGFPSGLQAGDLAIGPDGSVYAGGGNRLVVRRPSGTIETLWSSGSVFRIDVDALGVVHLIDTATPRAIRVGPDGREAPLIDSSGDGQGNPLQGPEDIVVADGAVKRILVVGRNSRNAFLITDVVASEVPALGPAATGLLTLTLLLTGAACNRARRPGRPSGRSGSR